MGGLMAFYTGLRAPEILRRASASRGPFAMGEQEIAVFDLVHHGPVPPLSIWLNAERYEWLPDCNRRVHELLVEKGYNVVYREYNGGHNCPLWRDELDPRLKFWFGALSGSPRARAKRRQDANVHHYRC